MYTSCNYLLCRHVLKPNAENTLEPCARASSGCTKHIHLECSADQLAAHPTATVVDNLPGAICGKRCLNYICKAAGHPIAPSTQAVASRAALAAAWDNTEVEGGKSAEVVLIDWLAAEKNYARWIGGINRKELTEEIGAVLRGNNISTDRSSHQIAAKVKQLQNAFRAVLHRERLERQGKPAPDERSVELICPHYEKLKGFMAGHITEDDILNDTDNEASTPVAKNKKNAVAMRTPATSSAKKVKVSQPLLPKRAAVGPSPAFDATPLAIRSQTSLLHISDPQLREAELEFRRKELAARLAVEAAAEEKYKTEAKTAVILMKATLLRERKKLLEEGVSIKEIDKHLPIE